MFRRRKPLSPIVRVWRSLWPVGGWRRALLYYWQRLKRLRASPHSVAAGFSAGVFASFMPFFGVHLVICALICVVARGNFLAAVLGTFVGNPLTTPWIMIANYQLGMLMLGRSTGGGAAPHDGGLSILERLVARDWSAVGDFWQSTLYPAAIGGVPLGIAAALAFYFPARRTLGAYQLRRQQHRAKKLIEAAPPSGIAPV